MTTLAPSMLRLKEEIRTVDPLLVLRGSGRTLWSDEHADEYIERLRREDVFDKLRETSLQIDA